MTDQNSETKSLDFFDPKTWAKHYYAQEYNELSDCLLRSLSKMANATALELTVELRKQINSFVENFLFYFLKEDFPISGQHAPWFIKFNELISNLVALSDWYNTDLALSLLRTRKNNFVKILALYSARNRLNFDRAALFEANPKLASLWYNHFVDLYISCGPNKEVSTRLIEHLKYNHPKHEWHPPLAEIYYGSTYLDPDLDAQIKRRINLGLKRKDEELKLKESDPKKIAVVSGAWRSGHAVFRNQFAFIEALSADYELTLFELWPEQCPDGFRNVVAFDPDKPLDPAQIEQGGFGLVYFPDVGMCEASIPLANLRLSPIQVTSYGHSVSSYGSEIDYFIGGADVELPGAQKFYSEKLVLIPGLGIIHKIPVYSPKNIPEKIEPMIINCGWSSQKCNSEMISVLREIKEKVKRKIIYRFLVGPGVRRNFGYLPFFRELQTILGPTSVQVPLDLNYPDYMSALEEGALSLDSFHFGGCNSVVDSLFLNKPIITWQGEHWYNRIGSEQLKLLGLSELITTSREEFIALAIKTIDDDNFRNSLVAKISKCNLTGSKLFDRSQARHFKDAIDYLLKNHARLKIEDGTGPIFIGR